MKQENHPKDIRTNNKGANQDVDKEILGADMKGGEYLDGRNLRVSSIEGKAAAAEKIKGEELTFPAPSPALPGDYKNIGVSSINDNKIEFWVDENGAEDPIIRINGVIVAKSPDIPFLVDFPLQHDKNESCIGGEIFVTDFNTPPMIFNIQDMLDSLISAPTKYFADFNPSLYTVNLEQPLNIPIFRELVNIGGGGGLPIGQYIYSIRYVTDDGDRANWSPATPPIPVVENLSDSSTPFPSIKTYGKDADISHKTKYGIKIRFRINNILNYDFIEIRRQAYNLGVSNILTPDSLIVAKIDIVNGDISVLDWIDPIESNVEDAISEAEEVNDLSFIEKAKAIRYHDKRLVLMNIETASKEANLTFEEINGKKAFPVVQKLFKQGHNDPFNHTYYKEYMGGEKYGFAINLFDGVGASGFSSPIPGFENYQFPNRRDALDGDSQLFSYLGSPDASTVTGTVDKTFEVFDLEDSVTKSDDCSFKNILNKGSRGKAKVNSFGCPDSGKGSTVLSSEVGYKPFRPTEDDDSVDGHDYRVNTHADDGSSDLDYNPQGFAPNYYSKGLAVSGVDNFPSWAKGFSVVRTEAAGRVVCQGLGFYSLGEADFGVAVNLGSGSKDRSEFCFYSPDIDSNLIPADVVQDIQDSPSNYSVQLVSPLGFFSELYNFQDVTVADQRDRNVDLMLYARMLHDEGQINPGESASMGVGSAGKRFVAYNRYRNDGDAAAGDAFGGDGNKLFTLSDFTETTEGRGVYYKLEVSDLIYNKETTVVAGKTDFEDQEMKDWTEPLYIINIVQTGAEIRDLNVDNYKSTGHFQKLESIIGIGDGTATQEYLLVDERWEDCIPDLSSGGAFASDDLFLFIEDSNGIQERWINVTFRTVAQITAIINDIITNGFYEPSPGIEVKGLYTHTNTGNKDFTIKFDIASYYPQDGDKIIVKYDKSKPLRVFGGDSTVGEAVFSPLDRESEVTRSLGENFIQEGTTMDFNMGLPFRKYTTNPRYYILTDTDGPNKVQDELKGTLGRLRQLCVMFACESRISTHFAHNKGTNTTDYFPLTNYVIRPNRWNPSKSVVDNNVFEDYDTDYPDEFDIWTKGGFRFFQQFNIDYSYDGPIQYFSKPDFGFTEENKFCTAIVWSFPRAVNVQDSPGLKTFTSLNKLDISDDQGEIKKAWDTQTGGKGENLYAITKKGVCLLLTKKSILSSISGDDLTQVSSDVFISGEYWISKTIGSSDEMWRGMGEGNIGFASDSGMVEGEVLFFPNKQSVYRLFENQIKDIGRSGYYAKLRPFLLNFGDGYSNQMTGVINKNHNEYWLDIENDPEIPFSPSQGTLPKERELFVYGNENQTWEGTFDYRFDNYVISDNEVYGYRDLEGYILEKGFIINGNDIIFELLTAYAPQQAFEKEFIRIGVNSGRRDEMKPTAIEFYDEDMNLLCTLDEATQGPLYLKRYDGWEQFIPRKDVNVSNTRDRVQDRLLICKIIHKLAEDFKVVDTVIQFKIIK